MARKYVRTAPRPAHHWEKGQSGNPDGRPKSVRDLQAKAGAFTETILETLQEIITDKRAPRKDRMKAAEILLDRGYGRPMQNVTMKGDPDAPLTSVNLSPAEYIEIVEAAKALDDEV